MKGEKERQDKIKALKEQIKALRGNRNNGNGEDRRMARMSALKSAVELFKDAQEFSDIGQVLCVAQAFYEWIYEIKNEPEQEPKQNNNKNSMLITIHQRLNDLYATGRYTEEQYRLDLQRNFNVKSSKDLSPDGLKELLAYLVDKLNTYIAEQKELKKNNPNLAKLNALREIVRKMNAVKLFQEYIKVFYGYEKSEQLLTNPSWLDDCYEVCWQPMYQAWKDKSISLISAKKEILKWIEDKRGRKEDAKSEC